jgi:hypothetical protein
MWEVIIFVQKSVSVLVSTYFSDAIQQSVLMMLVSLVYLVLVFMYSPFANVLMNFIEKLANVNIFLMYFCSLLFVAEVDGEFIVEGALKELIGFALCALCTLSVISALSCASYEWVQLAVLHKIRAISKWMKYLRFAIGVSFSSDSSFSLLFVLYNPICRRDLAAQNQYFNRSLAKALLPLYQKHSGNSRTSWFYIKRAWIWLRYALNQFDTECSPVSILSAVNEPHSVFLKNINRLNMLMKNQNANKHSDNAPSLLQRIGNFVSRRNRILPAAIEQDIGSDVPNQFLQEFKLKKDFVSSSIEEDERLAMLTLLFFNRQTDFGTSNSCHRYHNRLFDDGASYRLAMRCIFDASQQLSQRTSLNSNSFVCRLYQTLLYSMFGEEVRTISSFNSLTNAEQNELLKNNNFLQFDSIKFSTKSTDDFLAEFLSETKAPVAENDVEEFGSENSPDFQRSVTASAASMANARVLTDHDEISAPQLPPMDLQRQIELEIEISGLRDEIANLKEENSQLKRALSQKI